MSEGNKLLVIAARIITPKEIGRISGLIKQNGFDVEKQSEGELAVNIMDEEYCSIYAVPLKNVKAKLEKVALITGDAYGMGIGDIVIPYSLNTEDDYGGDPSGLCSKIGYNRLRSMHMEDIYLPYYIDEPIVECSDTWYNIYECNAVTGKYYDTPWEKEPHIRYFISEYSEDCYRGDIYTTDFRYIECPRCGRAVCEQNHRNGWHLQFRLLDEDDEYICLKCYEENILENGEYIDHENPRIIGMFLGDDSEMEDKGWVKDYKYGFANHNNHKAVLDYMVDLDKRGYMVIIGITSMGIGGSEGYFDMWVKKRSYEKVENGE